jgi:uncharacterized membrane protein YeaQ/YmgE (transglycosylase-associated protein family)
MLYSIIIGGVAGWLAGVLMKGGGFGLLGNIVIGIIGGFVGGWLFDKFGINFLSGVTGDLVEGVVGAVVLLFIASLFKKK